MHVVQRDWLTIRSLIQRTGVHRQTIHYYLRKGLLPQPVRTSRTSALYPPSTIELIKLVKLYQERRRLSLDEITALFRRAAYDPQSLSRNLALTDAVRPDLPARMAAPALPVRDVMDALEPPPPLDWLEGIASEGLVESSRDGGRLHFPAHLLEVIRSLWDGTRMGLSLDYFHELNALVSAQAGRELDFFRNRLRSLPGSRDMSTHIARLFTIFDQYGGYCRRTALNARFIESVRQSVGRIVGPQSQKLVPSETFLANLGLTREIDRLRRVIDRRPDDLNALRSLARACHLRSDWHGLRQVSEEILRLAPGDVVATAFLGRSLSGLGRVEESISALEEGLKRGSHPLLKLRLGQSLLMQAREAGDAAEYLDAGVRMTRLAAEALEESRDQPVLNRKVRLNLAIEAVVSSEALGLPGIAPEELEQLYREFKEIAGRPRSALGRASLAIARLYAAFSLYLLRQRDGHPNAERLRREILRMDPNNILAARHSRLADRKAVS